MKALILAGGYGTRLRPLSCTRPKHLFPVANKPLLDLTLERLAQNNVSKVIFAVNFMANALEHAFGAKRHGIRLEYSRDSPPNSKTHRQFQGALGTGGPIRQAEKLLGRQEAFFVINGDILTNANYIEIMDQHRTNEGVATIALRRVEDPTRFGVVELANDGRITRFVEKPAKKNISSNLINAGIYVLEPDIFKYIPKNKKCSIEREVFPELVKEDELFGYEIKDSWIDVGKAEDFIKANKIWIEDGNTSNNIHPKAKIEKAEIKETVAIDEGVVIGKDSVIGPNVALGKDVLVGNQVQIKNSIIFPNTTILNHAAIKGAIVGESVLIGRNVKIEEGCLIGDNTIIEDDISINHDAKICPSKRVSEDIHASNCII